MSKIDNCASSFEGFYNLQNAYKDIDSKIELFKNMTNMDCIKYCGNCCNKPSKNIEASVFEMLPLVIDLWQNGEAEFWNQTNINTDTETPCLFYESTMSIPMKGHCRVYT